MSVRPTFAGAVRDPLAWIAFLVTVAYVPFWHDAAQLPKWIVLFAGLPLVLAVADTGIPHRRALLLPAAAFGWAALTLFWSPSLMDGVQGLAQFAALLLAFALGCSVEKDGRLRDLTPVWAAFAAGIAVNFVVVVGQLGGGLDWFIQPSAPAGLFGSKNLLGEAALLALFAGGPITELAAGLVAVATGSKGVLLAVAAVTLLIAVTARGRWLRLAAALAGLGMLAACAVALLTELPSATYRLSMWRDTLAGLTPFGHGVGNWSAAYPAFQATAPDALYSFRQQPAHPHNDALALVAELGVGAALLPPILWQCWQARRHDPQAFLVLAAGLALGLAAFPLYAPATGFAMALAAGRLCGAWAVARDRRGHGGEPVFGGAADAGAFGVAGAAGVGAGGLSLRAALPRGAGGGDRRRAADAAAAGADRAAAGAAARAERSAAGLLDRVDLAAAGRPAAGGGLGGSAGAAGAGLAADGVPSFPGRGE